MWGVGSMDGWMWGGVGDGVEGSVTDSHLVSVARAARVVPLSAVAFDGLSCLSSFLFKIRKSHSCNIKFESYFAMQDGWLLNKPHQQGKSEILNMFKS